MLSEVGYFLYEFLIFMTCIGMLYFAARHRREPVKLLILIISLGIIISSTIASVFSFFYINNSAGYILIGLVLAVSANALAIRDSYAEYRLYVSSLINSLFTNLLSWKGLPVLALFLPLLFNAAMAPADVDSLAVMNSLLPMALNLQTPYEFFYDYVALWEMSYVPSLVITSSDDFLWLVSVKPMLLIGLGAYMICRTLNIPKFLALLVTFAGISLFHFWLLGGSSGISTLKNDMMFAAGTILLACYLFQSRNGSLLLLFGSAFALVKFSGVPVIILALFLLAISNRGRIYDTIRSHMLDYTAMLLAISGHYYIKNLVLFR